jgi:hypothetical protein
MQGHLAKHGFIPNYIMWHNDEEVELATGPESDRVPDG